MSIFSTVKIPRCGSNTFNLTHHRKLSTNMGQLTPILCEEVLPGDRWRVHSNSLVRLAPMLAPIMHNVNVYMHYFFVPNRILWNEWEDFITGGEDGTLNPSFPRLAATSGNLPVYCGVGSLADHLGVQFVGQGNDTSYFTCNALPFRAYAQIWNDYYRDQNLQAPIAFSKTGGEIVGDEFIALTTRRQRAWQKDYFTSALPWTQRGPQATIPIDSQTLPYTSDVLYRHTGNAQAYRNSDGSTWNTGQHDITFAGNEDESRPMEVNDGTNRPLNMDPVGTLYTTGTVDVSDIGIEVNDLRASVALQSWMENNARGGGRYFEQIRSHFRVSSPDARLQRAEYIGGGKAPISISEVLQTSSTEGTPLAEMAGHGISAGRSNVATFFAQEHGFVIGIMSILPRTSYQQGTRRFMRKYDRFDYAFPELAHLGEQPVHNFELYTDIDNEYINFQPFGYQSRYAEYKFIPDTTHGDFRTSLNHWTMTRIFDSRPGLNGQFVTADPTQRIYAVTDNSDKCWCLVQNNVRVRRMLPKFGIPRIKG